MQLTNHHDLTTRTFICNLDATTTSCPALTVSNLQDTHIVVCIAVSAADWEEDLSTGLEAWGGRWNWDWDRRWCLI